MVSTKDQEVKGHGEVNRRVFKNILVKSNYYKRFDKPHTNIATPHGKLYKASIKDSCIRLNLKIYKARLNLQRLVIVLYIQPHSFIWDM